MEYCAIAAQATYEVRLAGYVADTAPGWRARTHSNPNYELVVVTGRRVRFQRGTQRIDTSGGDFLLLRPNEVHTGWGEPDPDSGFYYAQFRVEPPPWETSAPLPLVHTSFESEPLTVPYWGKFPQPGEIASQVVSQFAELAAEWRRRQRHYAVRVQALLVELLVAAARHGRPHGYEGTPLRTDTLRKAEIVRRLLAYLDHHLTDQIPASEVQRELGYSYAYLCRLFREATGMRIRAYVHRQRIGRACHLLLDPNQRYSIAQVGEAVGYSDPCYFSRVFRQELGYSPRQYVAHGYAP